MADLLAPFRQKDSDEALRYIEAAGFDKLHMAFYKKSGQLGNDGVWDVWQTRRPEHGLVFPRRSARTSTCG